MNKQVFLWGSIPNEWSIQNLGELTTYISRGKQPNYVDYSDIRALNQKAIRWGFIDESVLKYHNPNIKVDEKHFIKKGDVVINSTGTGTVGRTYCFNETPKNLFADSHVTLVRTNINVLNPRFLMYQLSTNAFQNFIESSFLAGSTGQVEFNKSKVQQLPILIPTISEQNAIVDILSSLDDKIELNNQMNENLEEMAQALFKRWFVDFEFPNEESQPYKSSGGEMIESELGMIPKGWNVEELGNVLQIRYGRNLPKTKLEDKGYPVFGGNGVIGYFSEFMYREPQVLVSCRGAASGKVLTSLPNSYVTNNSLVLESNDRIKFEYLSEYSKFNMFYQYATGSAQPQITITNLNKAKILLPLHSVINEFSNIINSINMKKLQLKEEQDLLIVTRDTLLPKLLSGEIRVSDLEE